MAAQASTRLHDHGVQSGRDVGDAEEASAVGHDPEPTAENRDFCEWNGDAQRIGHLAADDPHRCLRANTLASDRSEALR